MGIKAVPVTVEVHDLEVDHRIYDGLGGERWLDISIRNHAATREGMKLVCAVYVDGSKEPYYINLPYYANIQRAAKFEQEYSLSYLNKVPANLLKIDKSFVDTAIKDKATNIITESVVDMVNKLGLETIAEGVEDQNQYEFLKKINCDIVQGFLMGKPMSRADFEKLFVGQIT